MTLAPGTRLGPYEILAPLGAGGMGEVYRARDTKLGRDVALKVLPEAFARDAERMARFQREAQVLASLNHPNIAAIYGLEESGGVEALVMELVEGPTLAERIVGAGLVPARGRPQGSPLQIDETLQIARQIAEGLEAAHERGIIHRDLKPANVKITSAGAVKLLDFGLAKALEPSVATASSPATSPLQDSPTISAMATQAGVILGTAAYMSPEQARGKSVDRRADIWAFGCVLFEMLAGSQAFPGETVTDVLAAVMRAEPDWDALPPESPLRLRELISRCLVKDPKQRLQAIGDARIAIEEILSGTTDVGAGLVPAPGRPQGSPLQSRWRRALPWALAAVFFAAAVAAIITASAYFRLAHAPLRAVISEIPPPAKFSYEFSAFVGAVPEISPDGTHLAFVALGADGKSRLWVRALDSAAAHPIEGTEGARAPFWSADSRYLAFYTPTKLKKTDVSGNPPVEICDIGSRLGFGRGGSWNAEGTILFVPATDTGLFRVPAGGGTAAPVTNLNKFHQEFSHRWPQFLPDGRHFLYFVASSSASYEGTYVGSLDGGEAKLLLPGDSNALYAPPGYLLFVRGGNLMAQRLDPRRLELQGDPVAIADSVGILAGAWRAVLSASGSGVLAYSGGGVVGKMEMRWFDRSGKPGDLIAGGLFFAAPQFSPDAKELAVVIRPGTTADLWVFDLARGVRTRLTFAPALNLAPIWSPDGGRIAFDSNRTGEFQLYVKAANGTGRSELLFEDKAAKYATSWSSDGRYLAFMHGASGGGKAAVGIWILPLFGDKKPFPFIESQFNNRDASFSPDGKWLAYSSDESGSYQTYVVPFPKGSGKWQVSREGGNQPHWRRDGKELFYVSADLKMTAVEVQEKGDSLALGNPVALFQITPAYGLNRYCDVAPDGKKFVVLSQSIEGGTEPITLVVNWPALLKKQ